MVKSELKENGILFLTLDSPKTYNALSLEMMSALHSAVTKEAANKKVKVIVVKAEGKGFCAGHDLKQIQSNVSEEFYEKTMSSCCQLMQDIQSISQPVIAQVHGVATAAGCQLVASCDLAVSSSDAKFATPGVMIGLFCSTPMVALSRNVSRKHALEMLFTGEMISAQRAYEIGLINRHVSLDHLASTVEELALKIASKSPYTISLGKKVFYEQIEMKTKDAYEYAAQAMVRNLLAHDAQEGIRCFLEKKTPVWKGE
ncbi:MAG: enoyl-CoA hydratase [Bacteriovoracia bacterium]